MTATRTTLRVAFAGGNGYPPEAHGGVQSSTHDLATRLVAAGGRPSVLAPLYGDGLFGLTARAKLKLGRSRIVRDDGMGYPVLRAWFPAEAVGAFCETMRPEVAVVQCHGTVPIAKGFQAAGVPVVVFLRNVEFGELDGDLRALHSVSYVANSRFTAESYRREFGIHAVPIPPTIDPHRYATRTTGEVVTFINPVPEKGLEKALAIAAACPEIPFVFVESWLLDPPDLERLRETLRAHPNIRFQRRSADMKAVYGRTRLLLAPSRWAEAWGRVASEAHCSGIPVIGANTGGLAEAIGPGGIALPYDAPLDDWAGAVRRLWHDDAERSRLSEAALAYAARPEMDADRQFATFLSLVTDAARTAKAA